MRELTTDSTPGGSTPAAAPAAESVADDPRHHAIGCPEWFDELQRNRDWWEARLEGRDWSGLVVARDDMPSVVEQRNDLARFGVGILDFKHPLLAVRRRWSSGSAGRTRRYRRATCSWS
jgi:hypothetical protein